MLHLISLDGWQEVIISVFDLDLSAEFFLTVGGHNERWRGEMGRGELHSFGLSDEAKGEVLLLGYLNHESGLIH